jgi:WhiB family redox-sensing transcriptional regulator
MIPLTPIPHAEWTEQALCTQTDPDAFFPEKGGGTRSATAVCARCLVRAECVSLALANEEDHGIWGGMSPRERRQLRRPQLDTAA